MTLDEIARRFEAKRNGEGYMAQCPMHADDKPSLSISASKDRILLHCHAGCQFDAILRAKNLTSKDLFVNGNGNRHRASLFDETYDYRDLDGTLRYRKRRTAQRKGLFERPDGQGGWIRRAEENGGKPVMEGIERLLYRIDEVSCYCDGGLVFIVEGEKDANRLWSIELPATTNDGGASKDGQRPKWTPALTQQLVDAGVNEVVCVPDNDDAGHAHMLAVAQSCRAAGKTVRILELPGLDEKEDVSDWLDRGHTREELIALADAALEYTPVTPETDTPITVAGLDVVAEHLTDVGNAARYAAQHGGISRYCYPLGTWFVYDGRVWRPDQEGRVLRLAKQTVTSIYQEASRAPDAREKIARWAIRSESAERLNAMLTLARSELAILPERLDANRSLINCLNGTLDLRDYQLSPHRADDLCTKLAPIEYDPNATSDLWTAVLDMALPDPDARRFLQKLAGATIDGGISADTVVVVHGPTRTSKGTVQEALSASLGDYAIAGELDLFAERDRRNVGGPRPELLRLRGARMVSIYETSRRLKLSASLVKTLSGSDPVTARALYAEPVTFVPECVIWIATNHEPHVPSDDDAIWERIRKIPFEVTIPRETRDPQVRSDLRDPSKHGAAIFAWMVAGHRLWRAEGLIAPPIIATATSDYRTGMNPLRDFVDECCVLHADAWTTSAALRRAYNRWASDNGAREIGPAAFQEALRQLGCTAERLHEGRGWTGIGLLDPSQQDKDVTA